MKEKITEKVEPTFNEPKSAHAMRFQDKFDKTMSVHGVNLKEVDKFLNEKEQSLKKKIFSLPKMESLVFSDPKLSAVYDEMAENGEEKYGYHYNETIMNMIFNEYVLNSSKYLQKYKQAVPKKKKRRDKSGIEALRKTAKDTEKRREELKKEKKGGEKKKSDNKKDNKNENLSETAQASVSGAYVTKANDTSSYEAKQIDTEREWEDLNDPDEAEIAKEEKMKDKKKKKSKSSGPVDTDNYVGGSSAKPTWKGGKIVDNPNNNINESDMEKENQSKKDKENTEENEEDSEVDETTTTSSAAGGGSTYIGYETPRAWSGSGELSKEKGNAKKKKDEPFWKGGEVIKESNYLTSPDGFEKYFNMLNETIEDTEEIKKILDGTEIRSLEHEGMVYVKNGIAYSADDHKPLNLDKEGWKNLYNEYFENEFGVDPSKMESGTYSWDQLASMGLIENNKTKDMNETHLETRDQKIRFIYNNMEGAMPIDVLKDMPDEDIDTLYQQLEAEMGMDENKTINEKAKSKSQQQAAGMALAAKRGEMDVEDLKGSAKKMYDSMSADELEDFAETEHEGLPKHVDEALSLHDTVEYLSDRKGEEPFTMNGEKWQFVNAKYPDGKTDIGVYRFGQDVVYDYNRWREEMGIDKNLNENKENLIDFDVPEWALSALINDDRSGLSDEDEAKLDKFVNDVAKQYGNAHFLLGDMDGEDNLGFKQSNDIDNLGSNVYRVYIDPSKQLNEKAESEEQRKAAGAALAAKRGEMDVSELYGAAKDMYDSMSEDELEDYASGVKEVAPALAALGSAAAAGAGREIAGRVADKVGLEEKEKWSKDVDIERGKMHKLLDVPQDRDIEDHYTSGEKLAQDLIDKVGREEAAGMINFAANINSEHNIYDDAQDWLDKTGNKENQDESANINEHHLSDKDDIQKFIIKAFNIINDTQEAENKFDEYFEKLSYKQLYNTYLRFEDKLRKKGYDPTEIDINEKEKLDEHHLESRDEKIDFIKKVSPILMDSSMIDDYIEILKKSSDEDVHRAYLKAEQLLRGKGYDPAKITESILDNQEMSMKLDPSPINVDTGSDMPKGMQTGGGSMSESKNRKNIMNEEEKFLNKINKDLELIEMHQKKLEEDRKPSSLVMKDRYGKENQKNFKQDLKHSGTKDMIDVEKELQWKDQQTTVENPQQLGDEIEKQHKKNTDGGTSFENTGNSTNNDGNEIPKRNATEEESNEVDLMRKGVEDYVFDNEPSERYKERMKRDMGDKKYKEREDTMDYEAKAPFYNKDSQPMDDGIEKVQYEKDKTGWNSRQGIKEANLTGKYVDEMGNTRFFDFSTLDVQEMKDSKKGAFFKMDMSGLGNSYNKKGQLLEGVDKVINEWEFYTDGKNVFAHKPVKRLNESEKKEKNSINEEQYSKMKHLLGYKPSDFIDTKRNKI